MPVSEQCFHTICYFSLQFVYSLNLHAVFSDSVWWINNCIGKKILLGWIMNNEHKNGCSGIWHVCSLLHTWLKLCVGRVPLTLTPIKNPYVNRGDQGVFTNLKSSSAAFASAFAALFVYGHYNYCTLRLPVQGSTLGVRIWRLQTSDSDV